MALVSCPDCGNQVSDSAPACPQCGRPIAAPTEPPKKPYWTTGRLGCAVIAIFLLITFCVGLVRQGGRPGGSRQASQQSDGAAKTEPPARSVAVYARRQINIRSGPGTSNRVVRQVDAGAGLPYEEKEGEWYKLGTSDGSSEWVHESVVMIEGEKRRRDSVELELLSWNWKTEHGYATAEGQVKNVSGRALRNVEVVVSFHRSNGDFITSADCMIGYNPVLPGQTSPFSCMATHNPAMSKAGIDFKYLLGGSIPWVKG